MSKIQFLILRLQNINLEFWNQVTLKVNGAFFKKRFFFFVYLIETFAKTESSRLYYRDTLFV